MRFFIVILAFIFCLLVVNNTINTPIARTISFNEEDQMSRTQKQNTETKMNTTQFTWTIDNFSRQKENAKSGNVFEIFSDPFLSHENGYQLMLQVDPNGPRKMKDQYLSFYVCIMKGFNDDNLPWPFKLNITLSIVNQKSNAIHHERLLTYDMIPNSKEWDKPIYFRNVGVGFPGFIKLEELENESGLILDNKIVVKCKVHLHDIVMDIAQEKGNKIVWVVKKFSQLRKEAQSLKTLEVFSEPFYSHRNGYEMILQLYPNGVNDGKDNMVSLYFRVRKGPFDDELKWPFKMTVTFELMNQHTNYPSVSAKFTDDVLPDHPNRNRPLTGPNLGFGFEKFVSFEKLSLNPGLIVDDKIVIRVITEI